jgi:hypothetical protein
VRKLVRRRRRLPRNVGSFFLSIAGRAVGTIVPSLVVRNYASFLLRVLPADHRRLGGPEPADQAKVAERSRGDQTRLVWYGISRRR